MTSAGDLLQRILSERRGVVVPLALVALVNLGFYALAVYPLSLKVAASERRAMAVRGQLAAAQREDKDVRATLRLTEQASKDLGRFYDEILPADLTVARRQTYEHLAALARERVAAAGLVVVVVVFISVLLCVFRACCPDVSRLAGGRAAHRRSMRG